MFHSARPPPEREGGLTHISQILASAFTFRGPIHTSGRDDRPEDRLAAKAVKYLLETAIFDSQREIATPWGRFELCFEIRWGDRRVGVEVAHNGFHQGENAAGSEWKDAILLGSDAVDTIYHIRKSDIERFPGDLLFLVSHLDPELFSARGRSLLEQVASEEVMSSVDGLRSQGVSAVSYRRRKRSPVIPPSQLISHLMIERRQLPPEGSDGLYADLRELYGFAQSCGPGTLAEVQVAYWDRMDAA